MTSEATKLPTAPRRRDRQATEAAFIAAATEIFAERGFEATTTKAVARQAGYSEALIQLYFGGKEGLLLAVIQNEGGGENELSEFNARPLADDLESEARETLAFMIDLLVRRASGLRIVLARVLVDPKFKDGFNCATVRKNAKRALIARLERHRDLGRFRPDADPAASAELLVSLGFQLGFIHGEILGGSSVDRDQLAGSFAALFGRATANS
ncbi:TetR/AcrR family transcriptional regulator (plasmid) [Polymorphobacter sp. PAMC 29334]|uniref:TetR/AcrR family transcriptional regulator n=1 Tax=Polymorphobacter sp. PAMC 29334 TaxID=2862331 RepID=UPI001C66516E|nr:TetR/AcrR family transcriptional regulator [Polymorphobacter sp. PAMC 29334]QYE37126.1 TetR/AcrR family transcriptional regulator [Polymorphobacter sp. PAMC 29334]